MNNKPYVMAVANTYTSPNTEYTYTIGLPCTGHPYYHVLQQYQTEATLVDEVVRDIWGNLNRAHTHRSRSSSARYATPELALQAGYKLLTDLYKPATPYFDKDLIYVDV